jgi:hypothetical protein
MFTSYLYNRESHIDERVKISEKFRGIYFEFLEIYEEYKR